MYMANHFPITSFVGWIPWLFNKESVWCSISLVWELYPIRIIIRGNKYIKTKLIDSVPKRVKLVWSLASLKEASFLLWASKKMEFPVYLVTP